MGTTRTLSAGFIAAEGFCDVLADRIFVVRQWLLLVFDADNSHEWGYRTRIRSAKCASFVHPPAMISAAMEGVSTPEHMNLTLLRRLHGWEKGKTIRRLGMTGRVGTCEAKMLMGNMDTIKDIFEIRKTICKHEEVRYEGRVPVKCFQEIVA